MTLVLRRGLAPFIRNHINFQNVPNPVSNNQFSISNLTYSLKQYESPFKNINTERCQNSKNSILSTPQLNTATPPVLNNFPLSIKNLSNEFWQFPFVRRFLNEINSLRNQLQISLTDPKFLKLLRILEENNSAQKQFIRKFASKSGKKPPKRCVDQKPKKKCKKKKKTSGKKPKKCKKKKKKKTCGSKPSEKKKCPKKSSKKKKPKKCSKKKKPSVTACKKKKPGKGKKAKPTCSKKKKKPPAATSEKKPESKEAKKKPAKTCGKKKKKKPCIEQRPKKKKDPCAKKKKKVCKPKKKKTSGKAEKEVCDKPKTEAPKESTQAKTAEVKGAKKDDKKCHPAKYEKKEAKECTEKKSSSSKKTKTDKKGKGLLTCDSAAKKPNNNPKKSTGAKTESPDEICKKANSGNPKGNNPKANNPGNKVCKSDSHGNSYPKHKGYCFPRDPKEICLSSNQYRKKKVENK